MPVCVRERLCLLHYGESAYSQALTHNYDPMFIVLVRATGLGKVIASRILACRLLD